MKVHIEIDCTPEEARTFMGLPDVSARRTAVYVDMMSKAMKGVNESPINCRNMPSSSLRWGRPGSSCSRASWKVPMNGSAHRSSKQELVRRLTRGAQAR